MRNPLKHLGLIALLYREARGIRQSLARLADASERLAAAQEFSNAQIWPVPAARDPLEPGVEVTYVSDDAQMEYMDIELRLTTALGHPPSEEEILKEWSLRRAQPDQPPL